MWINNSDSEYNTNSYSNVTIVDFKRKIIFESESSEIPGLQEIKELQTTLKTLSRLYEENIENFFYQKQAIMNNIDVDFDIDKFRRYRNEVNQWTRNLLIDVAFSNWIYLVWWDIQISDYSQQELISFIKMIRLWKDFQNSNKNNIEILKQIRELVLKIIQECENINKNRKWNINISKYANFIKSMPDIFFWSIDFMNPGTIIKMIHIFYNLNKKQFG
jgi:hypothetical protein